MAVLSNVAQPDLFLGRALHDAPSFRDDIDIMSMPFFTPEKSSFEPIVFERTVGIGARSRTEWLKVSPGEFGIATIFDKDNLLYWRTQIVTAMNNGEPVGRRIVFPIHDCLRATHRHTGKRAYELFKQSLVRLKTTTVLTNISTNDEIEDQAFGWIESFKIRTRRGPDGSPGMGSCEVVISEVMFAMMTSSSRAISVDPEYFNLTGGLERALYGIVRRHVGTQPSWHIGLDKLRLLCGSRRDLRKFKYELAKICERGLPGYSLEITKDHRPPSIAANSAPLSANGKRDFLIARPRRAVA